MRRRKYNSRPVLPISATLCFYAMLNNFLKQDIT